MLFRRKSWLVAGLVAIGLAALILPWQPLLLFIVYSTPQFKTLNAYAYFGNYALPEPQEIGCSVLVTTKGPIAAFNPVTARIDIIMSDAISVQQKKLHFGIIRVVLPGALAFPFNSTAYPYAIGVMDLHPTTAQNVWSNSKLVVYLTNGTFPVSVLFVNAYGNYTVATADFPDAITIGSSEATFSYMTSLVFVSLELVIVGMMLLDFSTHARNDTDQKRSKNDTWIIPY